MIGRLARGVAAATVLLAVVVGTPIVLLALVGNPWPGQTRLRLGDELAIVVGVLAVLAWLVWIRFVVAIVAEVATQLDERRSIVTAPGSGRVRFEPAPARVGPGRLAQRLVAAVLVLLPATVRVTPSSTATAAAVMAPPTVATAPLVARPEAAATPAPAPGTATRTVTVAAGDTLIGIARAELGDGARWRELFDANREAVQPDGGRLTSPSLIRVGWTLVVPAAAPTIATPSPAPPPAPQAAPQYVAAEVVTVTPGDNLWDLAHDRLAAAGLPHDSVAVADHVHAVIAGNADTIEDPNVIHVGERFEFPAVGTPPPVAPAPVVAPEPATAAPVAAPTPAVVEPAPPAAEPAPEAGPVVVPAPDPAPAPAPTTTTAPAGREPGPTAPSERDERPSSSSPAPIGIGEATLLSAGVLALVAARRRLRLRGSTPRARVPDPRLDAVEAERRLRSVDAGERVLRVDVAVRAAAASLVHGTAAIAVVRVGADGGVELSLTSPGELPPPWEGAGDTWRLPGATPIELLADAARTVGAPCVALAQLGVDATGRELLVDLEALGLLAIDAAPDLGDAVLRGIAATVASSVFAEVAHLVGAAVDEDVFLGHRHAHAAATVDDALELAATVVGATAAAHQSTFALRARHTSGEVWEPAVVLIGSALSADVTVDVARSATRVGSGLAVVAVGDVEGSPWTLRAVGPSWLLEPLGIELVPVGLSAGDVAALHAVIEAADAPLIDDEPNGGALDADGDAIDPLPAAVAEVVDWSLLVTLFGTVGIVDRDGRPAVFERSKALELVAWLTLHRERATRAGARTALWELDVRDATFANVVSEARRAMARLVAPPAGVEWLGRTLTELLPLHDGVVADVDLIRHRLDTARLQPPELAIETLRPAVELVNGAPFAGTGYLWPDAEGITSNLVLLATSATTELAGHFLSMGDIDGVFWATDRGLRVLPGHEELIALRMRAHACAGDRAGVRQEWESYERVLNADPWSDGEPAAKLVLLRRQLLSS